MRTDRFRRAMALATVPFAFFAASSLLAQPPSEGERTRFGKLLDATGGEVAPSAYARAWTWLDSLVVSRLNAGTAPRGLGDVLAALPGYTPAGGASGFRVGETTFFNTLPRDAPNYLAVPLQAGRDTVVLGLYSLMANTPGRMSVYARRQGRWTRTGGFDSRDPVSARLLIPGDASVVVAAFEDFVGGDRWESRVRLLRVAGTGMVTRLAAPGAPMVDPEIESAPDGLAVTWTRFPEALPSAVLGVRLVYRARYRAAGGRVAADTTALNPWVGAVDAFYVALRDGRVSPPRAVTAGSAVRAELTRLRHTLVRGDGGELERGEGWVDFENGRRAVVRRGPDGAWRVTEMRDAPPLPARSAP